MTPEPMTDSGGRGSRGIPIPMQSAERARHRPPVAGRRSFGAAALSLLCLAAGPARAGQPIAIPAAVHVHTTFSTGADDLDAVVGRARAAGLRAVLFSENYGLAFEYGIAPLDGLLRWRERFPSVTRERAAGYLEAVRRAQARHPDMVLIPGVEVSPYYYWSGSLLDGTLTMHDGQKNLLVFGLERAGDLAALPIAANGRPLRAGEWALRVLPPLLLAGAGAGLFRMRRERRVRWRRYVIRRQVRHRWAGAGLVGLAILVGANGLLAGAPHWDPKDGPRGYAPHQAAIDFVAGRGGAAVWSLPEAQDRSVHRRAGLTVTVRTDRYPDALAATRGYAAFGVLYADTTTVELPGGLWDRLILDYLAGRRPAWPVGISESAFHRQGQAGKTLDEVQTVFLASAATPAAVLEALRAGRAYAHARTRDFALVLEAFSVNGAGPGETAAARPGVPPRIALTVAASDGGAHALEVVLVRNGAVLASRRGVTPLSLTLEDRGAPGAGAWYYRVDVRGERGTRLLTNPTFVRADA